jgi:hypothetical protein
LQSGRGFAYQDWCREVVKLDDIKGEANNQAVHSGLLFRTELAMMSLSGLGLWDFSGITNATGWITWSDRSAGN